MADPTLGLIPKFVGSAEIVGLPVIVVIILIGIEVGVWIRSYQVLDFADGAVGSFKRAAEDEFSPPYAWASCLRSSVTFSGITRMTRYPLAAPTSA